MSKTWIYFFAVVILCAGTGADLTTNRETYNLGDSIVSSYSATSDVDISGIVKLALICSNYKLDYYVNPIQLNAGQTKIIDTPSLEINSRMTGKCHISASIQSFDEEVTVNENSNYFGVTSSIGILASANPVLVRPSALLSVKGSLNKSHSSSTTVILTFQKDQHTTSTSTNSFGYSLIIPMDTKSGKHELGINANDSFGNRGFASFEIKVDAVPTKLSIELARSTYMPGDILEARIKLTDQANNLMDGGVEFFLYDSSDKIVGSDHIMVPSNLKINLESYLPPGSYTAKVALLDLSSTDTFVVETIEQLSLEYNEGTLTIANTGNVEYDKELPIELDGNKNKILLSPKVELKPGETTEIELNKETPNDDYKISFPTLSNSPNYEDHLEDKRAKLRKVSDIMGTTGRVVEVSGNFMIKKTFSLFVLFIIFILIFYYYKKRSRLSH